MSSRSKSLIKNTSILAFGTLCTKGIMFFMTPLFTRWLTTSEYGTFDLLITYITLLVPLLTFACGESIFRFLLNCKKEDEEVDVLSTTFMIDLFGVIFSFIIALPIYFIFNLELPIVLAFLSYLTTQIFYNYYMMAMRGEKKLNIYTIGNILFVVGLALFVYLFVFILKMGLVGILLGYSCGDIISIAAIMLLSKINKKIKLSCASFKKFKELIKYSVPMIPNSISWWIVNVSDRTLISIFYGASYNAIYAVANKVPALCTTFFSVFHLSWQQNATESLSDKDRDIYYSNVFNNMIIVVGSICVLILGFNYWFFQLFTSEYFPGYYQAPILVLSIVFSMMGQFIGGIYVAQMKSKKNGFTTVMAAIINIIVNLILIKKYGLYAASISTLVAYLSLFIIRYIDIRKEIKLELNKKSMLLFTVIIYFMATSYLVIDMFRIINPILGIIFFIIINYKLLKTTFKKVTRKLHLSK